MPENLRQITVTNVLWSAVDKAGHRAFGIIATILIARALTPEDYGLLGMLAVFIAVAGAFVDSGFGQALIRKKNVTNVDFSTVFYFNLAVGVIVYTILFFSASFIADFYKEPKLVALSRAIFLLLIINSTSMVQNANLTKKVDFKTLTKVNLISVVISGLVGVLTAYNGFGVWALVFQSLSHATIRSITLWVFNDWRPIFAFSKESFKGLFSFGSKLLASGIIYQITTNIYQLMIGRYYDARSVGFYTQANRIQQMPASTINSIIQPVTYPVLAKIQDDNIRLKKAYRKIIKQITFFNFPVLFLLAIIASPFIQVLLTEKWLPAAPLLSMLCIAGMLYPLQIVNLDVLKVKGRSDLFLLLDIIKNSLLIVVLLITTPFGVHIMVFGQVILSFISYFLHAFFCSRLIGYPIKQQISDFAPYLLTTLTVGSLIFLLKFLNLDNVVLLITQSVLFAVLYLSIMRFLKCEAYNELRGIWMQKFAE